MATCATGSIMLGSAPSNRYVQYITMQGNSYSGATYGVGVEMYSQWGLSVVTENTQDDGLNQNASDSWNSVVGSNIEADRTHRFRARVYDYQTGNFANGTTKSKKSSAMLATTSTPTSGSITSTSATISCYYYPNCYESTASAQLQYKKTVDSTWINAGTPGTSGGGSAAYSQLLESEPISGLQPSTQYNVRLVITRDTQNADGQSLTSAIHSFTTLAGEPLVTTNAATSVTSTSAVLNGTLDINEGTGVNVHFVWDTANPPVANVTADQPMSADGTFQQHISPPLNPSTPYYFKAVVTFSTPTGSPNEGSVLSFTTPADPAAEALLEDHVFIREFNERKYKTATKVVFVVAAPASGGGASSDRFFNSASPFVAGDVKVAQESTPGAGFGSFANVGTLPARIGTTPLFELSLTAGEMDGATVAVMIVDQDGPAYRDTLLLLRTVKELGNVDVDATQYTNKTAVLATGVGTGHGISAVGGATGRDIDGVLAQHVMTTGTAQTHGVAAEIKLASTANANDNWYAGGLCLLVSGTGAGQARLIISYTGSTKVAVMDSSWVTNPDNTSEYVILHGARTWQFYRPELTAMPADGANMEQKMQFMFQRFAFKITQTAVLQTLFKADLSTTLATRSTSDNGATQLIGKLG